MKTHHDTHFRRLTVLFAALLLLGLGLSTGACEDAFDETRADQTYGIERVPEEPLLGRDGELFGVRAARIALEQRAQAQAQGEDQLERIGLDATLESICQVTDGDSPTTAYFDYDSSALTAQAREKLDQVALCMTEGALSEREVELQLIGSTDPRGSRLYNERLGMERARAVGDYLESRGVKVRRINSWSVGQLDVERESRFDNARRVEIRLVTS